MGKLDTPYKLHIDENVMPVAQPHRWIPFHLRKKVKVELDRLKELDIIEQVNNEPTPWISTITVVPKPKKQDDICICVDMGRANEAIGRERHVTPTMDDLLSELNGAVMFSKLDLNSGYHQVKLSPESRYITTLFQQTRPFSYKRLNFGVCSPAEKFQNIIQSALGGLKGVMNISDDILVWGVTETDHEANLRACLECLRQKNLTLKREKCGYFMCKISFFRHVFSADGCSPDPAKAAAIADAPKPESKDEVSSLLGMASYCSRFILNLATVSEPLHDLSKGNTKWTWQNKHYQALQQI